MKLLPLDSPELLRLVAGWMSGKENYQWLDFGNGRQILTPEWLKIATQRETEVLRVFTSDDDRTPVGVVGLTNVDRAFRTARIWVVSGDKSFRARGHATRAASRLLTIGFRDLGLGAINTWIVEGNPSARIAGRLNFKPIGRQRQCHLIDGRVHDRLWFDLLASEHAED
ncbi:MAG: GNAT family N-acetyltransferase [Acidobacteria bacterium]|nr:GNAT family N-acetyltransferase [Acidobacteriota bacterium]